MTLGRWGIGSPHRPRSEPPGTAGSPQPGTEAQARCGEDARLGEGPGTQQRPRHAAGRRLRLHRATPAGARGTPHIAARPTMSLVKCRTCWSHRAKGGTERVPQHCRGHQASATQLP